MNDKATCKLDPAPCPERAAQRPLGNTARSSSPLQVKQTNQKKRVERFLALSQARFWLMPVAQKLKPEGYAGDVFRTIDCKYARRADNIPVYYSAEHQSASYGNLATCGSVWACPVCCAKIQERRRPELAKLVDWAYMNGLEPQMITFTFPHTRFDSLADLLSKQRLAFKRLRSGKLWQAFKVKYGYVGLVRSLELTHGANGWHPHTHELFITEKLVGADKANFVDFIRGQWIKACKSAGLLDISDEVALAAFSAHSVDVRFQVNSSDYLAKQDSARSWGIERELTASRSKKGKGVHPHEFLVRAAPGDKDLYVEYVQSMKGQRQLYWSTGLKKLAEVEERTDEETAEAVEEQAYILGALSSDQWRLVRGNEARGELLNAAENGQWHGVLTLLRRLGCPDSARHLKLLDRQQV
jgi:hypothetical protein